MHVVVLLFEKNKNLIVCVVREVVKYVFR